MAFPVASGSHGARHHQHPAFSAFSSSNRPFRKHIAPLEVLSEATEETDTCCVSEASEHSVCSSPTVCTKESSSDEGAKLLVQPFGSSEISTAPVNAANGIHEGKGGVAMANVRQISENSAVKAVAEKVFAKGKVSFQAKAAEGCQGTQKSSKEMHEQMHSFPALNVKGRCCDRISSSRVHKAGFTRIQAGLQTSPFISTDANSSPGKHCFPMMSKKVTDLLHRRWSHAVLKLRGLVCHQQPKGDLSEDDGGFISQGKIQLTDTSLNDVNEMKTLLNNIDQTLKVLESRSKPSARLQSSTVAPVYFTT